MEVEFRLDTTETAKMDSNTLFSLLWEIFEKVKELESESMDLAELTASENSAEYVTCCKNTWRVEKRSDNVYFSYSGTRAGLRRIAPFAGVLFWGDRCGENKRFLGVDLESVKETLDIDLQQFSINLEQFSTTEGTLWVIAETVSYHTSTPQEWGVKPFEKIEPLLEEPDKAVIISECGEPRRIVPYKNVYREENC